MVVLYVDDAILKGENPMADIAIESLQEIINQQKGQITVLTREKNKIQRQADPLLAEIKNQELRNEQLLQRIQHLLDENKELNAACKVSGNECSKQANMISELRNNVSDMDHFIDEKNNIIDTLQASLNEAHEKFSRIILGHIAVCQSLSIGEDEIN